MPAASQSAPARCTKWQLHLLAAATVKSSIPRTAAMYPLSTAPAASAQSHELAPSHANDASFRTATGKDSLPSASVSLVSS